MAAPLSTFIAQYNNKFEAFPGDNAGYQCVDLVQFWAANFGYPRFTGNAVNIYGQYPGDYEWIANTPTNSPLPGDIVVWGVDAQEGIGADGHTGICVSANQNTLTVFNQNFPTGSPCHETTFPNYTGIKGWGRPKATIAPQPTGGTAEAIRTAYVRSAPNTGAPLAGSQVLQPGNEFQFSAIVSGQQVTENGVSTANWYHSTKGNYVWAGNCKTI